MRQFNILPIVLILFFCSGCASYVQDSLTDSFSKKFNNSSSTVFSGEEDPDLMGEALPFTIKMLEVLIESSPENTDLKATTAQAMLGYGKAWLEYEANLVEDDNFEKAEKLRFRAKRLYFRAKELGIKGIEQKYPRFFSLLQINQKATLSNIKKDDVALIANTGLAWILWISRSTQSPEALADIPTAVLLIKRALELSPDYEHGQLHEFFIQYYAEQGLESSENRSKIKDHWEALQKISAGHLCSPYLTWAQTISVKSQNRKEFDEMLSSALGIDADHFPEVRLSNNLCQREAKLLKKRADDLFL